jgi:hypothetical protein
MEFPYAEWNLEARSEDMIFDKNQEVFSDCIQERVWELGTRQLPLDVTLSHIPEELKSACIDYHDFSRNLLADMYENPKDYGLTINENQPDWMNKKQVEFYSWFIIGLGELDGNRIIMPTDQYHKLINKFNIKSIDALLKNGFYVNDNGKTVTITNIYYPDMFIAAKAIYNAGRAYYKVNCDSFMIHCDFRALTKYKRTYEDLHLALNDINRTVAYKIHEYNISRKIMPQKCNYFYRVEYKFKGKIVYISDMISKNDFKINIGFAPFDTESFFRINSIIESEGGNEQFKAFCHKYLAKSCTNCNPNCETKKYPKEVFGKKRVICGYNPFFRLTNPTDRDLEYIFKLIDLRAMVISEGISEPFYPGNG